MQMVASFCTRMNTVVAFHFYFAAFAAPRYIWQYQFLKMVIFSAHAFLEEDVLMKAPDELGINKDFTKKIYRLDCYSWQRCTDVKSWF